jgi:hypothetical protein
LEICYFATPNTGHGFLLERRSPTPDICLMADYCSEKTIAAT